MSELTPCPECQRHVRKTETRCPFCGEAVSLAHLPAPVLPRKRLGRAATFAFGASVLGATALVACSDGSDDSGSIVPAYGAPLGGSSFAGSAVHGAPPSGSSSGGNAGDGAGTAVYGAPAAGAGFDDTAGAGNGGNGGASGDGGASGEGGTSTNGGFGGGTIYGGPPSGAGGV